jgi:hypothetical protein
MVISFDCAKGTRRKQRVDMQQAHVDDLREEAVSEFQSVTMPADGMFAACSH